MSATGLTPRIQCPYCGRAVKASLLARHQRCSARCQAYQVLDWLKCQGYERLTVENPLWHRFVVEPPEDPKPRREEVPYPWHFPLIPAPPEGWAPVRMPDVFWDLGALEPPRPELGGLPGAFRGPVHISGQLRADYGVWVHESIREPMVRALEHAMAEKIVQAGGAIPYRKQAYRAHRDDWYRHDWFRYLMGEVLRDALAAGSLQTFLDNYRTGAELARVPDKPNDLRVPCPHCGKKVLPRNLQKHQKLAFCRRAACHKAGLQMVWELYAWSIHGDPTSGPVIPRHWTRVWDDLAKGARELGVALREIPVPGRRSRRGVARVVYVEMWAQPPKAEFLRQMLEGALRLADAQGAQEWESLPAARRTGLTWYEPGRGWRAVSVGSLVKASPLFAKADLEVAVCCAG